MTQMRVDIAARAAVNTALNCYGSIPDQIETPAFVVGPVEDVAYNHTFNTFGKRTAIYRFACRVYVGRVDMEDGISNLDPYIDADGATSIHYLLDDQQGEAVSNTSGSEWTNVRECREVGVYDFGGVQYLGAEFLVEVLQ